MCRSVTEFCSLLLTFALSICPAVLSAQAGQRAATAQNEQSLDGGDWLLGSFAMDAGITAEAEKESFDEGAFRRVVVPGEVQLQLGLKGQELFHQTTELTSINQKEWWYRKHFRAVMPAEGKRVLLQFDGADYFASVWLNGKLLGNHEGTFVPFSFDVTTLLRTGKENVLAVRVTHPWIPKGRGLSEYITGNFTMSAYFAGDVISHPPYTVRGDWDGLPAHGNATFAMGLERSVHLTTVDVVRLTNLYVHTESIQPDGSAVLAISGEVQNDGPDAGSVKVDLSVSPSTFAGKTQRLEPVTVKAAHGMTAFRAKVTVQDAHLWWTWDQGAQNLYELNAQLDSVAKSRDQQTVRFGIRTLTRDADMTYKLNGRRIFIRASWFPIEDYFMSRATRTGYDRDLRLSRDANLNMLVNFTVVEKPEFYDLCDEIGMLIVVEMPFPQFGPGPALGEGSPRRQPFLDEAKREIGQIITEHRNHPAIVEWGGIAESHDAAGEWTAFGYRFDQSGYQAFSDELEQLVQDLSPGAIFQRSLCDFGEKHFWIAEAGQRYSASDYQDFFDAKAGFISEYGDVSMSSYEKLGDYLTPQQQWDPSNLNSHSWFGLPIDLSAYSYLSASEYDTLYSMLYRTEHYVDSDVRSVRELVDDTQIYQAFQLKYATEAFRRKKYDPIMGIRSWDFQEIGPGFRFGVVDLDRIPKVGYYWLKKADARLAVNFAIKDALEGHVAGSKLTIPVWAINDLNHDVDAKIECGIYDVKGRKIYSQSFTQPLAADGKAHAGVLDWMLPEEPGVYLVRASLTSSKAEDSASDTTFVKVVPRAFQKPMRVLVIGQSETARAIAEMLRAAGITVDVRDEESIGQFDDLADGKELHAKYDAIWLAHFEVLAKVFDAKAAEGVKQAVAMGTGFITSGGEGSYHGGNMRQSLVETTPLGEVLPVILKDHNDLVFGAHGMDDVLTTEQGVRDIAATTGEQLSSLALLQHYGVKAYNQVIVKAGCRTILTVGGSDPLLVTGTFGLGHTVSFTGFTPILPIGQSDSPIGQQLIHDPANRAFFAAFVDLVSLATARDTVVPSVALLDANEKPLFQTLKEQPATKIDVRLEPAEETTDATERVRLVRLKNGASYAHLVRLRVEWDTKTPEPYLTEFDDNAFEMLPGEERTVRLSWRTASARGGGSGELVVDGANVRQTKLRF